MPVTVHHARQENTGCRNAHVQGRHEAKYSNQLRNHRLLSCSWGQIFSFQRILIAARCLLTEVELAGSLLSDSTHTTQTHRDFSGNPLTAAGYLNTQPCSWQRHSRLLWAMNLDLWTELQPFMSAQPSPSWSAAQSFWTLALHQITQPFQTLH